MKLKSWPKLIYNFIFKTRRRSLTLLTVWLVAVARFRIYFYHGSKLHKFLGTPGETEEVEYTEPRDRGNIFYVYDRVKRVAHRVPWEGRCLVQAMTAQRLLKKYGLKSTLYLGAGRDPEDKTKMAAHAWVRCGTVYVCGGDGRDYATVSKFTM